MLIKNRKIDKNKGIEMLERLQEENPILPLDEINKLIKTWKK
jgi:hypothetical protein